MHKEIFRNLHFFSSKRERYIVYTFKYLGPLLTPNHSSMDFTHSISVKKKAKRIIYRNDLSTLLITFSYNLTSYLTLYSTLAISILEYNSVNLLSPSIISALESVQHFGLKLAAKSWSSDYQLLLSCFNSYPCSLKKM